MLYFITKLNIFNELKESSAFFFNNRYLIKKNFSVILDIKAIRVSIVKGL